jgi:hypothetical protein
MQDAQRALGITTTKGARRVPISFHSANKGTEHGRHDPCLERLRAVRPKALGSFCWAERRQTNAVPFFPFRICRSKPKFWKRDRIFYCFSIACEG